MSFRAGQIVSKGSLWIALWAFGSFHVLPQPHGERRGWDIWLELWEFLKRPGMFSSGPDVLFAAALLMSAVLIVGSPFLGKVWIKSKLAWGMCLALAGISATAYWVVIRSDVSRLGLGDWCLLASPALNFIGLLFARVGAPANGMIMDTPYARPQIAPADDP